MKKTSFRKAVRARGLLRKSEPGMYEKARAKAMSASKKLVDLHQHRAAGGDVTHMHIAVAAEAAKHAHEKAMIHATKPEDVNMHEKHADKATQIVHHAHAASLKEAFHPEVSKSMKKFHVVRVNGSSSDTHAHETLEGAHELANPDAGDKVEHGVVHAKDAGAARLMKPKQWQLHKGAVMDFNDFFKSEEVCSECGQGIEKSHGPTKGSVAEDNKKSPKHAGSDKGNVGKHHVGHYRGKGGNEHKKNKTEKSDEQPTLRKAFPVSDTFKAVEYVNENGQIFSEMEQFAIR